VLLQSGYYAVSVNMLVRALQSQHSSTLSEHPRMEQSTVVTRERVSVLLGSSID
jgi:hypothetical protein